MKFDLSDGTTHTVERVGTETKFGGDWVTHYYYLSDALRVVVNHAGVESVQELDTSGYNDNWYGSELEVVR